MDIKTKFDIGDSALFLMSINNNSLDVKLMKGIIKRIDIIVDYGDLTLTYELKVEGQVGNPFTVGEEILCHNDKEIIEYIFKNKNLRQYLNKNHQEKINTDKDKEINIEEIFRRLGSTL